MPPARWALSRRTSQPHTEISPLKLPLTEPRSLLPPLTLPPDTAPAVFPADAVPRQGRALRSCRGCSDGAGAKAIPCARRADGAPQQARTSPGRNGREGSRRRPSDTRRAGYSSIKETPSTLPQKGEYGGAGGVEGDPLSPHAPRRAGDLPPAPGSRRNPRKEQKTTE